MILWSLLHKDVMINCSPRFSTRHRKLQGSFAGEGNVRTGADPLIPFEMAEVVDGSPIVGLNMPCADVAARNYVLAHG